MITSFTGPNRFLSNFWPAEVELEGLRYPTVEHAYQAAKTLDEGARLSIRDCPTPGAAKRLGKTLAIRPDWSEVRVPIMLRLLRQKFALGTPLAEALLATGTDELVEGNLWGDIFWGVCHGRGENWLGRLLMQVRRELCD